MVNPLDPSPRITDSLLTREQEDETYPLNKMNDRTRGLALPDSPLQNLGNLKDFVTMLGGHANKGIMDALLGNDSEDKQESMLARQMALAKYTSGLQDAATEKRENNILKRDLLKTKATPIDPKKYEAAQEAYVAGKAAGMPDETLNQVMASFGFAVKGGNTPGVMRSIGSALGVAAPLSAKDVVLEPVQTPMAQLLQQLGLPGAVAEVTDKPKPDAQPKPGSAPKAPNAGRRIRDKKTGRTGTLAPGAQLPPGAEFITE
jgi:hypothetical protein